MGFSTLHNPTRSSGQWPVASGQNTAYRLPSTVYVSSFPGTAVPGRCPSPLSPLPSPLRPAFTLIEMLIVVTITLILVAVAVTRLRPALESRRIREAARAIDVYLGSARNHAIETGRPCGVMLRLFRDASGAALVPCVMFADQCEYPSPYAGDTVDAVVRVQDWTLTSSGTYYDTAKQRTVLKAQIRVGDFSNNLIRAGDRTQLNGQGSYYEICDDKLSTGTDFPYVGDFFNFSAGSATTLPPWIDNYTLTLMSSTSDHQVTPWPKYADTPTIWSQPVAFRISRQPVKIAATSLQLPAGAVIDMNASGIDDNTGTAFGMADVVVMFGATGAVEYVSVGGASSTPTQPIFLLVGKRERVGNEVSTPHVAADPKTWANWRDLENIWVVIHPQTGLVTTCDVAAGTSTSDARALARDAQGMGGR